MNHEMNNYMKTISNAIETIRNKQLDELNLTATQADVLVFITSCDKSLTQRDIEYKFNLSNPTVNGILNRLEKKGFIKRQICETDLRCKYIIPTADCYKLKDKMDEQALSIGKRITKDVTDEERKVMLSIFSKILRNLEKEKGEI